MPQSLLYQLRIYVSPSGSREEIAHNFPYKDNAHIGVTHRQVIINLSAYLYSEQTNWLVSQRDKGNIADWIVEPIYRH